MSSIGIYFYIPMRNKPDISLARFLMILSCLSWYVHYLYELDRKHECIAMYEGMLLLNPNDNQGIRDMLMIYLIEMNEDDKFRKYAKKYRRDSMAFALYSRALFYFKTEGPSAKANEALGHAIEYNPHVPDLILSLKAPIDIQDHYSFGDGSEATYFADYAHPNMAESAWCNGVVEK